MKILRIAAAVILGYVVMVLLITLVQETWFGGVSWNGSPYSTLFVAGFFTFLSAVVAGIFAAVISGGERVTAIVMSGIVVLETIVLLATGRVAGPVWFDFSGSASLVVGIIFGWAIFTWLIDFKNDSVEVRT